MNELRAKFTLNKTEPIKAKFTLNLTPSKVSQLENDMNFVTKDEVNLPDVNFDDFVTETELDDKCYLTEHQDISHLASKVELTEGLETKQPKGDYALKSEIPKLQSITQADYDALTTKDANTLYLIEE